MKVKLNVMEIKIWKYCVNIAIILTALQGIRAAAAADVVTVQQLCTLSLSLSGARFLLFLFHPSLKYCGPKV